jgi:hypothetical protein
MEFVMEWRISCQIPIRVIPRGLCKSELHQTEVIESDDEISRLNSSLFEMRRLDPSPVQCKQQAKKKYVSQV